MSIGRNTAYNLAGLGLPVLLGLVTVPAYLKLIGPDRYGVLAIAWLLLGYFGLFDLGLGRATSYQIAALKDAPDEERAGVFWSAVIINLAMGVVGGLVLLLSAHYFFSYAFKVDASLKQEIVASVPVLSLSVPIATLTGVLLGALVGRGDFLASNVISTTSTALFQIFPLFVAWWWGPDLLWLLVAAVAARVVAILALWWRSYRTVAHSLAPRFDRAKARALLSYGGWVTLAAMLAPVLIMVDRFAIGAVLGAAAVAVYSIPIQLAQRLAILPLALTNALFPHLPTATPEERRELSHRAIVMLASAMGGPTLVAILLLHPFLNLWVGAHMGDQAAPVGLLLVFGFWVNAFAIVPYTTLQATGRPDVPVKVYAIEIPVYLGVLYLFMQKFGLVGCAGALILRNVADYCVLSWAADGGVRSPRLLLAHAAILGAGVALAAWPAYGEAAWWLASLATLAAMGGLSWLTTPADMKRMALDTLAGLNRRTFRRSG